MKFVGKDNNGMIDIDKLLIDNLKINYNIKIYLG